ncbi:hypothetical protein EV426DRAFT_713358 [Tirmania nivea]|nr:hypothetical protein EV426DRAFT_713358 [Tirmania nivea]
MSRPSAASPEASRSRQQRASKRQRRPGGKTGDRNRVSEPTGAYGTDIPCPHIPGFAPTGTFTGSMSSRRSTPRRAPTATTHQKMASTSPSTAPSITSSARTKEEGEEEEWDAVEAYFAYLYRVAPNYTTYPLLTLWIRPTIQSGGRRREEDLWDAIMAYFSYLYRARRRKEARELSDAWKICSLTLLARGEARTTHDRAPKAEGNVGEGPRVKGHSGVKGNEDAGRKAKETVSVGKRMPQLASQHRLASGSLPNGAERDRPGTAKVVAAQGVSDGSGSQWEQIWSDPDSGGSVKGVRSEERR